MTQEAIRNQAGKYFEKVKALADYLTEHPEISGEEALAAMKAVFAAVESSETGKSVKIS